MNVGGDCLYDREIMTAPTLFIFNQGKAAISLASAEGANLLGIMDNQGKRSLCTVV